MRFLPDPTCSLSLSFRASAPCGSSRALTSADTVASWAFRARNFLDFFVLFDVGLGLVLILLEVSRLLKL